MAGARRYTQRVTNPWNPVEIVTESEVADEPLGTKQKFWVENPDDDRPWLFKFVRERDGEVRGEDWAEWVVHQTSGLIGVPTAEIRAAVCGGHRGVVSRSVVSAVNTERLVHGNSLLAEVDPDYEPDLMRSNPRYTIAAVKRALFGVRPPAEFIGPSNLDGFDVWAGYLVMDALVAARDRHHENWGIVSSKAERRLAPSYDHGNALGFQENDDRRGRLLASPAARDAWLRKGRSHHVAGKPSLVDLAHEALALGSPTARRYWRGQLQSLDVNDVRSIVDCVPFEIMSDPAHRFVVDIVSVNRERLLRDYPGH